MNTRAKDAGTGSYEIKTKHKTTVSHIKHLKKKLAYSMRFIGFQVLCSLARMHPNQANFPCPLP